MKKLIIALAICCSTSALAEEVALVPATACQTEVVFDRICAGMTYSDIEAAYAKADGTGSYWKKYRSNAGIDVKTLNEGGTISKLVRYTSRLEKATVVAALDEKYGQHTETQIQIPTYASIMAPPTGFIAATKYQWKNGRVVIEAEAKASTDTIYEVVYTVPGSSKGLQF